MLHRSTTRLLTLGGLLALALTALAACLPVEMSESERALLIPVSDMERYGARCLNPDAAESYSAKRNLDGSLELEYEYDWEEDDEGAPPVWIVSEAEINANAEDASESLEYRVKAYALGIAASGADVDVVEDADLFPWGDEAYAARTVSEGYTLGNIVVVRQGRTVLSLLTLGLDLERDQLRSLFEPRMLAVPE